MTAALAAAVLLAFTVGWLVAPRGHSTSTAPTSALPGPTRIAALGIPVGYPDTQAGAVSAAANLTTASLTPAGRDPAHRDELLAVIATPAGRELLRKGLAAQDAQLVAWFGSPTSQFTLAGTVVSTKVESFTPSKSVVDLWAVITTSRPSVPLASAFWGGQRVTLEWLNGDWKVADSDATLSAPIPSSQQAAGDPNDLLKGFTADRLYTGAKP